MQVGVPVSVAPADAPLVSPPPQVIDDIFVSELCSTPSKFPLPTSYATSSQSTQDVTPNGSFGPLSVPSETPYDQQQAQYVHERNDRFSIATLERSGSHEAPRFSTQNEPNGHETSRRGERAEERATQLAALGASGEATEQMMEAAHSRTPNGAVKESSEAKNTDKMWFNVLPMVLENIKMYNREQIRQLSLPRCAQCERGKVGQKAVIRCKHKGCVAFDCALCLPCWKLYHGSVEARKHRGQHTSACPQCHLDWVAYWCAECDLKFCRKCFEQIHSVFATKSHRKIATEDAPGTCLVTSHWSANFQNVIIHMIASRKQMINGRTGGSSTIGSKRKRSMEVIVIDEEEEEEEEAAIQSVQLDTTLINRTAEQLVGSYESTASQQNGNSRGTANGFIRRRDAYSHRQQNASASTNQNSMIVLDPLLQKPMETTSIPSISLPHQTRSAYGTSSTVNSVDTVNIGTNGGSLQRDAKTLQFGASSQMRDSSSIVSAANITGNEMVQATLSSMPAVVNTMSASWSTCSATDMSSTSNYNGQPSSGDSVFADNALINSLVDHYHKVNQNVTSMELQSEQLKRQVALATYQGLYSAGSLVTLLRKLQPVLDAATKQRNQLLITIIIQSNDIMTSVRCLRLAELGDVPQVSTISHRKCLQLTNEIDQHKKSLVKLYQQLSDALNQSRGLSSRWESALIRATSADIQMHEKSIKKLQKAREVEFVRVVQFSHNVREALRHAFRRVAEVERQQLQRQQSPFQPSR